MLWPLSSMSARSISSGQGARRQSFSMTWTSRPNWRAILIHSFENWPLSNIKMPSPGDRVLTIAASPAPLPDDGRMKTSWSVRKTFFRSASRPSVSSAKDAPR